MLCTVRIDFIRATNLPIGDLNNLSSDPFIHATLVPAFQPPNTNHTNLPLTFRTPTIRRNKNPEWNTYWIVSGIPQEGFSLELSLRDEDPDDHDDKLAKAFINVGKGEESRKKFVDGYDSGEMECKLYKRDGSIRAHVATYIGSMISSHVSRHGRVYVRISVLGKAADQKDKRVYTVGPNHYSQHFSPMIGHLTHTKAPSRVTRQLSFLKADQVDPSPEGPPTNSDVETPPGSSTFIATKLQLTGPPPPTLHHHYVGYRRFITSMFSRKSLRGHILHRLLHKQYDTVYSYDKSTICGTATSPQELVRTFLDFTDWGDGARIFTYVIMLDGEWRFTETGKEFAIDLLSKHGMHSDVTLVIAFSGEFFVRRIESPAGSNTDAEESARVGSGSDVAQIERRPQDYELIIDNDSGTYRPKKEYLPDFERWLSSPENFGGPEGMKVRAMDGFDKDLEQWKKDRTEERKRIKKGQKGPGRTHCPVCRGIFLEDDDVGTPSGDAHVCERNYEVNEKESGHVPVEAGE